MLRSIIGAAALASALVVPASAARPGYIEVRLIASSLSPKPGQAIWLGLEMKPKPGWHGYWSNPGESGLAPVVKWAGPRGVRFGPLQHPAPTLLRTMGLTSYVHSGPHMLLARMTVDPNLPVGTVLPIAADLKWAACSDKLCVPQRARLALRLTVGRGALSADAGAVNRALARMPKRLGGGSFAIGGGRLVLTLPSSARLNRARARFFPDANGYWDPLKAHAIPGTPLRIASPAASKPPKRITGVVTDGTSAFRVSLGR